MLLTACSQIDICKTISTGSERLVVCVGIPFRRPRGSVAEGEFVSWRSPAAIASENGLADRASIYRHAHALGLFARRQRNVRAALERIIERAGEVDVTAASVVAAVQAYSKINAAGQWIDRNETVNMNELFERMTKGELEAYARDGSLPAWFTAVLGATPIGSRGE